MRAAVPVRNVIRITDSPELSRLVPHNDPLAAPGPGELLVRVRASSLNYHDYMVATGIIPVAVGRVPLSDGAGEVISIGDGVRGFAAGDRVLGTFFPHWADGQPNPEVTAAITGDTVDGFAADHVVMPAVSFMRMPESLSYEEAATLPCAGVTAWCALTRARVTQGDTVVVQGSGSVSIVALQLARTLGARVVALTSSPEKRRRFEELGADHVIDYRETPEWSRVVVELTDGRGVDLVIDVAAGEGFAQSIAACRQGGRVATIGFLAGARVQVNIPDLLLRHIDICGLAVGSRSDQQALVDHIDSTGLRPVIDSSFPLDQLEAAFQRQQSGRQFGKIAVSL